MFKSEGPQSGSLKYETSFSIDTIFQEWYQRRIQDPLNIYDGAFISIYIYIFDYIKLKQQNNVNTKPYKELNLKKVYNISS